MINQAIDTILKSLPDKIDSFEGTQYPMPVRTTFLGDETLNINDLHDSLNGLRNADAKDVLEPLLLAAEVIESASTDKAEFFITDAQVRSFVFTGSKWRAGWVLVLGSEDNLELIEKLKEKDYMVFTDCPDIKNTCYIGNRETSPIYFLQMMVRYGLIWGRIKPGDDHEMGHFLEKDMPGFMIIAGELTPLKYLTALGIMKLGAPALVPSDFPFPYGRRIVTDDAAILIEQGVHFSNLRMRYYNDEIIELPDGCNIAFANEEIKDGKTYGATPLSYFFLEASSDIKPGVHITGKPSAHIGIKIEIENSALSRDLEQIVEMTARKAINYLKGIKSGERISNFYIKTLSDVTFDSNKIGEAIYYGIRLQFPRLEKISITFIYDEDELSKTRVRIDKLKLERRQYVQQMTEENTEDFCVCMDCRPFSLEHTCIITPERIPMCASRTYYTIKAQSLFGSSVVPFRRQSEKEMELRLVFNKGNIIDLQKGEYQGCNEIYSKLTSGRLERVYLHSLRNYPHTSCGCFQNLAFWIEEVGGIGIMSRGSNAVTPNGKTWDILSNYAGGKQSDGITGVSLNYIRSRHFLKGDGGIGNVVWTDQTLYEKISDILLSGQKVATELNVSSMDELKEFN